MAEKLIEIEIDGVEELEEALSPSEFKKAINTSLVAGAGTARAIVKTYPTQRLGRKQPFKTLKSLRWFFANLKSGKLRVPYRRTGTLGRKWFIKVIRWSMVRIGNNTPYAPVVQYRPEQSRFHKKGGWKTTDDIVEQDEGKVIKEVNAGINNYLRSIS
jgi:hypothetical protein